jgi:hypothetical protein
MTRVFLLLLAACAATGPAPAPTKVSPPAPASPRLTWQDWSPYLVANLWPHAVHPEGDHFVHVPPAAEATTELAGVDFHMALCIGFYYKGQGLIEHPDERLLQESCNLAKVIRERGTGYFQAIASSAEFEARSTVADRLRYLRQTMVARIAADAAAKQQACAQLASLIVDCAR